MMQLQTSSSKDFLFDNTIIGRGLRLLINSFIGRNISSIAWSTQGVTQICSLMWKMGTEMSVYFSMNTKW